jgi:amino acid efflux transporter
VTLLSMLACVVAVGSGIGLTDFMLLTTGGFTLVYVLGCAAAVRLLPRRTWGWWMAVVALASVLALLAMTGLHVAWAVAVAAAGLFYRRRVERREREADGAVPELESAAC